uniref:Uncharacterized protein n=1 Tax=Anguilla anguilla TaxID=7936 RepID=A0A0E9S287_ANGAN
MGVNITTSSCLRLNTPAKQPQKPSYGQN